MAIMPIERGKIREYATATAAVRSAYLDDPKAPVPPTFLATVVFWTPIGETLRSPEVLKACAEAGVTADLGRLLSLEQDYVYPGPPPRGGDPARPVTAPLSGLRVIDLSTTLPGAQATQFLADAGADVILIERPGGSPLRADPGWPGLLRGKRSIALDLHADNDQATLDGLLAQADVLVATLRPAAAARLGLTAERLAARYPRLVAALITGWGSRGPWADYKGYEALIIAKTGVLHSKRQLTPGPDPAYVSVRSTTPAARSPG